MARTASPGGDSSPTVGGGGLRLPPRWSGGVVEEEEREEEEGEEGEEGEAVLSIPRPLRVVNEARWRGKGVQATALAVPGTSRPRSRLEIMRSRYEYGEAWFFG